MDNEIHPDEEATVRAFIVPRKRSRWVESLASPAARPKILNALNHCSDLDERFVSELDDWTRVLVELQGRGAPPDCHAISCADEIDGRTMPLDEAIEAAERIAWGTIISCIPGKLAYYLDECGARRFLLQRED